jgi:hypothetical protein
MSAAADGSGVASVTGANAESSVVDGGVGEKNASSKPLVSDQGGAVAHVAPKETWLVRTPHNWIAGPYLREQLIELMKTDQIKLVDEVCPATGYWFFLHERPEVQKFFGLEALSWLRASGAGDDETTATETAGVEIELATTGQSLAQGSTVVVDRRERRTQAQSESMHRRRGDDRQQMHHPVLTESPRAQNPGALFNLGPTPHSGVEPPVQEPIEGITFFKVLTVILSAVGIFLLIAVIRLLK